MVRLGKIISYAAPVMIAVLICMSAGFAQESTYVGNSQCKICHNKKEEGEQWNKWKQELHAKAFELLSSEESQKIAKEKGLAKPAAESPECLRCHVTSYDAATQKAAEKINMADGVQCESCHGPSSLHIAEGKKFKSGDKSADPKKLAVHPDETACKKCHNKESATWREDRYKLEDGTTSGFDFKQAWAKINHKKPAK
jgi:hypothetical protein